MKYIEYGKENKDVIILLHGGGLSWWNYRDVAYKLSDSFRIILPILDGHDGSDDDFISIEDNALRIIDFIDNNLSGSVLMIGGLSLGAQVLIEILTQRKDICKYALIESALVIPSKITSTLIKPAFDCSYDLIKYKWFSKLQFKSLKIKDKLYEEYYQSTCAISKKNMIAFLRSNLLYELKPKLKQCMADVHIFVGDKEKGVMLKSAKLIKDNIKNSTITILPNMYHGEFSINYADVYVNTVLNIINVQKHI